MRAVVRASGTTYSSEVVPAPCLHLRGSALLKGFRLFYYYYSEI